MNLVFADEQGQVYDHPRYAAIARSGESLLEVLEEELIPLPEGSTLVNLPHTRPIGMDPETGEMLLMEGNAVGALLPQGFTRLLLPGYMKTDPDYKFPLFGYTAVVWKDDQFYVAAIQSDEHYKWNPIHVSSDALKGKVDEMVNVYPENRVVTHLAHCAIEYGCLTAANTFLNRWEGGIPVSYSCNAGCYGCISEQPDDSGFVAPQTRMNFKPETEELVEILLHHLQTPESIISFGQGCEGEPTTQAKQIVDSITAARQHTKQGYINMNTNGGLTDQVKAIVDAGLDLIRVSTISAIDVHYDAYYKPRGYTLENVEQSLRYCADHQVYTSINYLCFPGVFDREEEMEAMIEFVRRSGVKLIQLRNLNIDPDSYLAMIPERKGEVFGMKQALDIYRKELPDVTIGSYTHIPPESFLI